jgi:ribosomal protein S18 acetylase RimI-like enzyme
MSGQMENLYKVQKKDIPKAGVVLADAFQQDPIGKKVFRNEASIEQRGTLFEAPIKYCLRYGEVYAPSEQLEGIALWVAGDFADLTLWRLIRSGAIISGMRAIRACTQPARQGRVLGQLQADRETHMKGRVYVYLMVLGVATEFQGQGFGGKLLRALMEESEQVGIPIYVETETERNASMYERFGFRVLEQITLPNINLPLWKMVREPDSAAIVERR